jgi:hypothetical protein
MTLQHINPLMISSRIIYSVVMHGDLRYPDRRARNLWTISEIADGSARNDHVIDSEEITSQQHLRGQRETQNNSVNQSSSSTRDVAMFRQPHVGATIRWFVYGGLVGLLVDAVIVLGTEDWQRWQTPRSLLATVILVAIFGLLIRILQDHQVGHPD